MVRCTWYTLPHTRGALLSWRRRGRRDRSFADGVPGSQVTQDFLGRALTFVPEVVEACIQGGVEFRSAAG